MSAASAAPKPNILWLISEDHGPEMGCNGDGNARTPNVDALATKGMLFRRFWPTAPVCAPARTGIISGLYTSSSGGRHMRSMVPLPAGLKLSPQFLRETGCYCSNNNKQDDNFRQPYFSQILFATTTPDASPATTTFCPTTIARPTPARRALWSSARRPSCCPGRMAARTGSRQVTIESDCSAQKV